MYVGGERLEVVPHLLIAQIARIQDVLDFIRHEQFAELRRDMMRAQWYVRIAGDEHQLQISDICLGSNRK